MSTTEDRIASARAGIDLASRQGAEVDARNGESNGITKTYIELERLDETGLSAADGWSPSASTSTSAAPSARLLQLTASRPRTPSPTPSQLPNRPRAHSEPLLLLGVTPQPDSHLTSLVEVDNVIQPLTLAKSQLNLNLIDFLLPREIRLYVLFCLVESCKEDWEKEVLAGKWRGDRSTARWVGERRGWREVVKVGRVSRSWHSLSLDGQLWADFSLMRQLGGADIGCSPSSLTRLFCSIGTFLKSLDLRGLTALRDDVLIMLVEEAVQGLDGGRRTALEKLDLSGCFELSSISIDHLLAHSPDLTAVNLCGLPGVQSSTLGLLMSLTCLASLDIARCPSISPSEIVPRLAQLPNPKTLKSLRIGCVGIASLSDLRRFSNLETLDISHSKFLTDAALADLVTVIPTRRSNDTEETLPVVQLLSSQMSTIDVGDSKYILPWRHLNLTGCRLLTDRSFHHLRHSLPNLSILEAAQIGPSLRSSGLVKFLENAHHLVMLDLEDAGELEDSVLKVLTPATRGAKESNDPGAKLRRINISACGSLTDEAIWDFVQKAPVLEVLEADGTQITETTSKAFIRAMRSREVPVEGARLSIGDNRQVGRRFQKEVAGVSRTREGQRGFWAAPFGYHDELPLAECDRQKVVVRSFCSDLAVDAADLIRRTRPPPGFGSLKDTSRAGRMARRRALQDMMRGGEDVSRGSCIVS
ncbi:RNI-like protein [Meredithblackwellia eburnea MCA 4105]